MTTLLAAHRIFQPQGTRRHGSEEAPPIDWIIPPGRRQLTVSDQAMSEIFAYHSVTVRQGMWLAASWHTRVVGSQGKSNQFSAIGGEGAC